MPDIPTKFNGYQECSFSGQTLSKLRDVTFDGAFDARITSLAYSDPPEGSARWTLRLLAEKAVELQISDKVSAMTIQRSLKKTNYVLT